MSRISKEIRKTKEANVSVKLTVNQSGGEYRISGQLVDGEFNLPLTQYGVPRKRLSVKRKEEIESGKLKVIGRLLESYREKKRTVAAAGKQPVGIFSDAYRQVVDKTTLEPSWAESTRDKMRAYLTRQVLPRMDSYGVGIADADMDEIMQELLAKANKNRLSYGDSNTEVNVMHMLQSVNGMLQKLEEMNPTLPEVRFNIGKNLRRTNREQIKSLPNEIRDALAELLLKEVENTGLALACSLMFCGGLRTSEAAAATLGEFEIVDNKYATYYVQYQISDKGERIQVLKTKQAYRQIVLPYFWVVLYQRRVCTLKTKGWSDDKIMKSRIAWELEDKSSSVLSDYVKKLMQKAGCTPEMLEHVGLLMRKEPDVVDNVRTRDVAAYILRRDWCSRFMDVCGADSKETDYRIGHSNKDVDYESFLSDAASKRTAEIMERYVFHPNYTLNPGFAVVMLSEKKWVGLGPNSAYRICAVADKPVRVEINIEGMEPGGEIRITHDKPLKKCAFDTKDARETQKVRPILGKLHHDVKGKN